jgi:stage V sporulation protein B
MAMVMNQLSWLGFPEIERGSMYGYLGRAITMFSFPPTIISAIAISIVPAIAAALAVKNKEAALNNAKSAFRLTILFAIPCSVGLSALARPILQLLYADGSYYLLLTVMGLAVMFVTMVQVCNAVLQAWGKVWVPVVNMAAGGIVKVIVNLLLVSHPAINIYGAPIGTLCCYLTVTALNIHSLKKVSGIKFEFADFILKPVVSAVVTVFCALAAYEISYPILNRLTGNYANLLAVALSIGLAGTGYFVCLLLIKGFKREDILLLPKGERIANLFKL